MFFNSYLQIRLHGYVPLDSSTRHRRMHYSECDYCKMMEMHVKVSEIHLKVTVATTQDKKEAAMTVLNGHVVVSCNLKSKKVFKS